MSAFYWVVYSLVTHRLGVVPPCGLSVGVWRRTFVAVGHGLCSLVARWGPHPCLPLHPPPPCGYEYFYSKPTLVAFVHFHQRSISDDLARFTSAHSNDHKYSYLCSPSFRLLTCTHSCSTSTTSTRLFPQQRKRCVPFRIIGQALPISMRCE